MTGTASEIIRFLTDPKQLSNTSKKWDLKEHKERRSLDSNAYFHVLCDKLRQKRGISMSACKNDLITSYGQIEYDEDGKAVYLKANIPPEKMAEQEFLHCLPIKAESDNVIFYRVYRGSHTYNSSEMAELIRGTVDECKAEDIETVPPDELAHMAMLWERRYGKKHSNEV